MASVMILGPYVDGVIEPTPAPTTPGRQQIVFDEPATAPGGNVNLKLVPPAAPTDIPPINIYAFHVPQPLVPALAQLTPDWLFKSGHPNASVHAGTADPATGKMKITVPGVKPSLTPYRVQTVIEYAS